MNTQIKDFIHKHSDLLDKDISEFLNCAIDKLDIPMCVELINILKNSEITLDPKSIFEEYKDYKLIDDISHIKFFINQIFNIDEFDDFNGFEINNLNDETIMSSLRHSDIYVKNYKMGNYRVAMADLIVSFEGEHGHYFKNGIHNNIQIRFYNNESSLLAIFTYYTADIEEEIFNLFKVIPNYGIGYNEDQLNEIKINFIDTLKECLKI